MCGCVNASGLLYLVTHEQHLLHTLEAVPGHFLPHQHAIDPASNTLL